MKKWMGFIITMLFLWAFHTPQAASAAEYLTVEETAYRLSETSHVAIYADESQDVLKKIDEISISYASFDGFKHRIKYYYYVEQPDIYYIQVFMESLRQGETLQQVRSIAQQAGELEDDFEKMQFFNHYLVNNVVYDYESYLQSLNEGETSNLAPWSAEGALLDGVAVCEGYAGAFMLICQEAGIPCIKVTGSLEGIPHAWNKVYLAQMQQWYHVDVTNNDTDQEGENKKIPFKLYTDAEFRSKGYIWNEQVNAALRDIRYPYLVMADVTALHAKGIVVGRGDGDFALTSGLTRNELAAILMRLHRTKGETAPEKSTFPDVAPWAESAVAYCQQARLLGGYPDGTFRGDQVVTKQEWANILLRLLAVPRNSYDWETAEQIARKRGLISAGRTSKIHSPQATRADVFASLTHFVQG